MSTQLQLPDFDGKTYERAKDHLRLGRQLIAVRNFMADGQWHKLSTIAKYTGYPEASVSARLRDLRKEKFGNYIIERERFDASLFLYRLVGGSK